MGNFAIFRCKTDTFKKSIVPSEINPCNSLLASEENHFLEMHSDINFVTLRKNVFLHISMKEHEKIYNSDIYPIMIYNYIV